MNPLGFKIQSEFQTRFSRQPATFAIIFCGRSDKFFIVRHTEPIFENFDSRDEINGFISLNQIDDISAKPALETSQIAVFPLGDTCSRSSRPVTAERANDAAMFIGRINFTPT